jgi:hypothetical protein
MLTVTFSDLTVRKMEAITDAIKDGVQFTFLILDSESKYVATHCQLYYASMDLKQQMQKFHQYFM